MLVVTGNVIEIAEVLNDMVKMAEEGGGWIYGGGYRDGEPVVVKVRVPAGKEVMIEELKAEPLDIGPSLAVYNHTSGFAWGYGGSGPAQLALALLLDATGDKEKSLQYHQRFKERFVATWRAVWRINSCHIIDWLEREERYADMEEELGNV